MTSLPSPPAGARRPWSVWLDAVYFTCLAGLLLAFAALMVWRPLNPALDFWGHAGVGRLTWEAGRVPDRTLHLWTADQPWVYHAWLSQLLFYGLTNVGGPGDLPYVVLAFTTLLASLPFALVWVVWHREGRLSSWIAIPIVLGLKGLSPVLVTRPELFTEVCLCLLLAFLVAWSRAPDPARPSRITRGDGLTLAAVLLLMAVWANLHGAVVFGVLVLGATAVCDLAQDRFAMRARVLALVAVLAPAAVCVNPYGLSYWQAIRPVTNYTFEHISEWSPVWKGEPLPGAMLPAALTLAALALVAWALNPDRRWAHLGWLVLLGILFVRARRNVWPFSLTCLMVLAANARAVDPEAVWRKLSRWVRRRPGKEPPGLPNQLRWPIRIAVLAWVVLEGLPGVILFRPWRPLTPTRLEQGVVRFLREHQLPGRVFNDYENSSYLQWRLAGQPPLYIDLFNAYPDDLMRDYQDVARAKERGRALLDEQQVGIVVLTTNRPGFSLVPLANYLDADARWVRVYVGGDGVIWVRRTPEYKFVWGPHSRRVSKVSFGLLERWGQEDQNLTPPIAEDYGPPQGEGATPEPGPPPVLPRN